MNDREQLEVARLLLEQAGCLIVEPEHVAALRERVARVDAGGVEGRVAAMELVGYVDALVSTAPEDGA